MKKAYLVAALLGFAVIIPACSSTKIALANFPSLFSGQEIRRDIDYGSDNGAKLDVYFPDDRVVSDQLHPVIIFFHGGSWKSGDKDDYRFAADAFTSRGYVVVIPDYAEYPTVKFPAWQKDAAKAVAWVHKNIAQYKGDSGQIFLLGHSAGASIAALVATDGKYLAAEGGSRKWIKAFAGLAGPYDFTPEDDDIKDMFQTAGTNYRQLRVSTYIDGKQPPMLLLWGKSDDVVGAENIEKLSAAIEHKGGEYKVKYYDGVDHIDIIAALSIPARGRAPVVSDVDQFFEEIGSR